MSAAIAQPTRTKLPLSRVLAAGGLTILLTVIVNTIVFFVAKPIVNPDPSFVPFQSVAPTIIFTIFFLVFATIAYALVNLFAKDLVRTWTIVAIIGGVLSLVPDFQLLLMPAAMEPMMGVATTPAVLVLILMHITGWMITLWVFTKWAVAGQ